MNVSWRWRGAGEFQVRPNRDWRISRTGLRRPKPRIAANGRKNSFGQRRPERSALFYLREYRKRRKPPFVGRPHLKLLQQPFRLRIEQTGLVHVDRERQRLADRGRCVRIEPRDNLAASDAQE